MKNRELAQTVESRPKSAKKAALPSVAPEAAKITHDIAQTELKTPDVDSPVPNQAPVAPKVASSSSRDRRGSDERRGRQFEKAPPGTRTKMLKIIYDKRSQMLERQRKRRLFQLGAAVVALILAAGFAIETKRFLAEKSSKVWEESVNWWDQQAAPQRQSPKRGR